MGQSFHEGRRGTSAVRDRCDEWVDGGAWQVPPGLAVDVDDFGGLIGVALVR